MGGTVGRKLWGLTRGAEEQRSTGAAESSAIRHKPSAGVGHQVLCITHLPQLAAYGDAHFHVTKHVAGERTVTDVRTLTGDDRVAELAQMMGADSEAGRASVVEMMAEVMETRKRK